MTLAINEETFGAAVRTLREGTQTLQKDFAKEIGVSGGFLSRLERGQADPPSDETLRKMAKALSVNEDLFMAWAGRLSPKIERLVRSAGPALWSLLEECRGLDIDHLQKLARSAKKMRKSRQ